MSTFTNPTGGLRTHQSVGWPEPPQETFPARRPPKCGCPQRFRATSLPRTCVSCLFTPRCCDTVVKLQSRHSRDMVFLAFRAREHKRSTSPEEFANTARTILEKNHVATVSRPCRDRVATVSRLYGTYPGWQIPIRATICLLRGLISIAYLHK